MLENVPLLPTWIIKKSFDIPNSYDYIIKYCKKQPENCDKYKQRLCKKVLKLSNYEHFPLEMDFCAIYKELATKSRHITIPPGESYVSLKFTDGTINTELLTSVSQDISPELNRFLDFNGYSIRRPLRNINIRDVSTTTKDDTVGERSTILV